MRWLLPGFPLKSTGYLFPHLGEFKSLSFRQVTEVSLSFHSLRRLTSYTWEVLPLCRWDTSKVTWPTCQMIEYGPCHWAKSLTLVLGSSSSTFCPGWNLLFRAFWSYQVFCFSWHVQSGSVLRQAVLHLQHIWWDILWWRFFGLPWLLQGVQRSFNRKTINKLKWRKPSTSLWHLLGCKKNKREPFIPISTCVSIDFNVWLKHSTRP